MSLTEDQIKKLLEWFMNDSETNKKWYEKRINISKENHQWIQPNLIKKMSDEELKENFLEYFNSGGGRQSLNAIYRDRIIRDIEKFRKTLLFLLDENIDLKDRFDKILKSNGEYHIKGFGKAILTSFLMDYSPEKYCLWNNKTEMGFSVLGWKVYKNNDLWGTAYIKVLEALKEIKDIYPEGKLNLEHIDLFLHTISAEEEGIKVVEKVIEGREIIEKEPEAMEFAMEKYLEEFIESNFNKIFGSDLKLHQNEESSGRQYPTAIGKIDLLAIDKKKKEFVVIELKKGRSSDIVIGQILRYMGWVKENLADDYKVRGIIIVKEEEDRIKYALKFAPDVSLYKYSVSFGIEKC